LMHGKNGADAVLDVPLGTIARDAETGEQEAEITEEGQTVILVPGGRGGMGNNHFKSATKQTPRFAQPGEEGQDVWKVLELKVLADVGLVGFPNAGKSTLLSVVSAAKPEIADYPFTTLVPNLGIVEYRDFKSFVWADIPGIIEGASEGKGLGIRFLKHIERNSSLLFLIPADDSTPRQTYSILLNELEAFNPELLLKRRVVGVSKADLLDEELMAEMKAQLSDLNPIFFSSVTGHGIPELKDQVWSSLHHD